jgi:hypothetical protein
MATLDSSSVDRIKAVKELEELVLEQLACDIPPIIGSHPSIDSFIQANHRIKEGFMWYIRMLEEKECS